LDEGQHVELNIVSKLNFGDYASRTTRADWIEANRIIRSFPGTIHHFTCLPNDAVTELLKRTHVGLLPSHGDPYGYSVLEAQACGCPVITTDIRAFPEINSGELGWLIPVPKNQLGYGLISTSEERARFSAILEEGLYRTITNTLQFPGGIREKGIRCLTRIKAYHDPAEKAREIERIYDAALA
jgi:glycosyltransferase involved in cell wall biosynthesis